jgi:U3 small nucleolar RNA-associated protein 19
VASFIKRLSRLALTGPPAGVIMIIPFVYNLFKRHPGCMVMLQRLDRDGEYNGTSPPMQGLTDLLTLYADPYDEVETSPTSTRAIDSSCWELAALQGHYVASVSTLAKIFAEVFTKPEFNMEDFLDHGYGTVRPNRPLLRFLLNVRSFSRPR